MSRLSEEFCAAFSAEKDGRLCGLYHDIGKYSLAFQQRLEGGQEKVDHSTAGALLMFEKQNAPAAMCIAGHHAGLADIGTKNDLAQTFMGRINKAKKGGIEDCSAWRAELPDSIPQGGENRADLGNYFYTKMLFSALTDADWLDTEAYFLNQPLSLKTAAIDELLKKLDTHITPWWDAKNDINLRRCRILKSAIEHGNDCPGLFSMTVPTGGGKTVSSMAFALNHAVRHGMCRIIYVIPYCSILEQTQIVFEGIFGKENIIAHYTGAEFSAHGEQEELRIFSAENWEAPIILTTAVQFFESIYSNKPGKNRKLHNIAQSVIIFDEAQMLLIPFLRPCLAAICELVKNYGCSAVLCSATQPAVESLLREYASDAPVRELCPEPEKMYQAFRRVIRNTENLPERESILEVAQVSLNTESTYSPYVLGRLFAVLEGVQQAANPGIMASLDIGKSMLIAKVYNARWILERATRDHALSVDCQRLKTASAMLKEALSRIEKANSVDSLRGIEGDAAAEYFGVFNELVLSSDEAFVFHGRSRRPPTDCVNAMLSFSYALLASQCAAALESVGLDPYVGFVHADRPGRESLALDLMEELRPTFADRFVLSCINNRVVNAQMFETTESGAVLLNEAGRRAFLKAWQERKKDILTHPFLKEKIPWGLVPFMQALLLARFLRGDLDAYPPFLWK